MSLLNHLAAEFEGYVEIFGELSAPDVSHQAAQENFAEFESGYPVLFDASNQLLEERWPYPVSQVCEVSSEEQPANRGAIDNVAINWATTYCSGASLPESSSYSCRFRCAHGRT